jgi:hypothetical protein
MPHLGLTDPVMRRDGAPGGEQVEPRCKRLASSTLPNIGNISHGPTNCAVAETRLTVREALTWHCAESAIAAWTTWKLSGGAYTIHACCAERAPADRYGRPVTEQLRQVSKPDRSLQAWFRRACPGSKLAGHRRVSGSKANHPGKFPRFRDLGYLHSRIETTAIYANAVGAEERKLASRMWTRVDDRQPEN